MTPKLTLNTTGSYVLHMYVTSIHESQISLHFALIRAIFEKQAILRQVHQMTSNWPWTLQGQITLYMHHKCPQVSNFTQFHSMTSCFRDTGNFETSALNDPKWYWTLQGQRYPIYVLLVFTSPKFHSISLYNEPFSKYRPFWDKCSEWPQIGFEPCKVNLPYTVESGN